MKVNLDYSSYKDIGIDNKLLISIIKITLTEVSSSFSDVSLSLAVVNDDEIKRLNKKYRHQDKVTDVLSFSGNVPNFIHTENDLGEIIIAFNRCMKQAQDNNKTFEQEFIMLFVHGLLHLLGYDHVKDREAIIMDDLQNKILEKCC